MVSRLRKRQAPFVARYRRDGVLELYATDDASSEALGHLYTLAFGWWVVELASGRRVHSGCTRLSEALTKVAMQLKA
jgi:hypothetical protein